MHSQRLHYPQDMCTGVHKSLTPGRSGALYLWILSKEFVSYHASGAKDFEVASKLFGVFLHPYFALIEKYFLKTGHCTAL